MNNYDRINQHRREREPLPAANSFDVDESQREPMKPSFHIHMATTRYTAVIGPTTLEDALKRSIHTIEADTRIFVRAVNWS